MINPDDLQQIKLINFSGAITYNSNGYAVLPSYTVENILASVQPADASSIRFLPEGTHYADFIDIYTDYNVDVDNTPGNLGDYFVINNLVYKIFSDQNYKNFTAYTTNHIECTVARDNRLTFNGTVLNLPYPEIDSTYAPLFELIKIVNDCFTATPISVLWAFQQELRPNFPMCAVNIEEIIDNEFTNYDLIDGGTSTEYKSRSTQLIVGFKFYTYDRVQSQQMIEDFKMFVSTYNFSSDKIGYGGFYENSEQLGEELYENRTIFNAGIKIRFNFIVQQTSTSTMTINTAAAALSFRN